MLVFVASVNGHQDAFQLPIQPDLAFLFFRAKKCVTHSARSRMLSRRGAKCGQSLFKDTPDTLKFCFFHPRHHTLLFITTRYQWQHQTSTLFTMGFGLVEDRPTPRESPLAHPHSIAAHVLTQLRCTTGESTRLPPLQLQDAPRLAMITRSSGRLWPVRPSRR